MSWILSPLGHYPYQQLALWKDLDITINHTVIIVQHYVCNSTNRKEELLSVGKWKKLNVACMALLKGSDIFPLISILNIFFSVLIIVCQLYYYATIGGKMLYSVYCIVVMKPHLKNVTPTWKMLPHLQYWGMPPV